MYATKKRITSTISKELYDYLSIKSDQDSIPVSQIVEEAINYLRVKELENELRDECKENCKINLAIAEAGNDLEDWPVY